MYFRSRINYLIKPIYVFRINYFDNKYCPMYNFLKVVCFLILLVTTKSLFSQTVYYVATNGSDKNTGTSLIKPFATLTKALKAVVPGDTIYLRSGVLIKLR